MIASAVARKAAKTGRASWADQVALRQREAERGARREVHEQPARRGIDRGAAHRAHDAQVRLQPGQQEQEHHAEPRDDLKQVELRDVGREERGEGFRREMTEDAGTEQDAGEQLADHGGLTQAPHDLGQRAGEGEQRRELEQEHDDGVPREGRQGRRIHVVVGPSSKASSHSCMRLTGVVSTNLARSPGRGRSVGHHACDPDDIRPEVRVEIALQQSAFDADSG